MKKILLSLFALMLFPSFVMAYDAANQVSTVGKKLITSNSLPSKTTFKVVEGSADNSKTSSTMVINISKDDLAYSGNDNETAAVVAHTMGEIINGVAARKLLTGYFQTSEENQGIASSLISNKISMDDNKDADIIGVDLMIKANYNPLAMIVVLTKQPGSTVEALMAKPANSQRAMYIFDYLSYNYPDKIKAGYNCQEYRAFLAYAQPIADERQASKKKLQKFNKEQEKIKAQRAKKIQQYKTTGGVSGWDATYNILNGLTTAQ